MKRLRSFVDRIKTAQHRALNSSTLAKRRKWNAKLKLLRREFAKREKEMKRNAVKRRQARVDVLNHPYEYGLRTPNDKQLEFMQDYIHYKINKPLSEPDVLRRFIWRRGAVRKKLKHANSEMKLRYFYELAYLKLRITQTLTSPETNFDLDPFLAKADSFFTER